MPTMEQINDDELNDDDKETSTETKAPDNSAATLAAIEKLTRTIATNSNKSVTTTAQAEKKADDLGEFGALLQTMLANGTPMKDLEPLVQLHLASQNDLKKQMKEMVNEAKGASVKATLDGKCYDAASSVLGELADIPQARLQQAYLDMMWEHMSDESNDDFAAARAAYNRGVTPTKKDFEKAARLVLKSAGKETVKTKDDSKNKAPQLDTGNSRPTPSKDYLTKSGDVDKSKLTDLQLEVYTIAWNATKSKQVALHALQNIAPAMQNR